MRIGYVSIASMLAVMILYQRALATDYYVSTSSGNDQAQGSSESAAWKTLERASKAELAPGDRLLLKQGDQFTGMLAIDARGTADDPIVVSSFGEGGRPAIDGNGAEACIRLTNPAHLVVRSLRLTNSEGRYGIRMTGQNAGELSNVLIESLDISDIYKPSWDEPEESGHGPPKYFGGINAQVLRGQGPSWWNGLTIRECVLHDLGTCGISIGSGYPLHEKMRTRRGRTIDAYPIRGVLIEHNQFRDIARDGAIIRQCQGAVLENNSVIRTGRVSMSNGIWFWDSQDSIIRFNVGSQCGVRGRADGGPFSVDYYCKGCIIENNYSHDNEGPAFMVFGNNGTGKGTIIRGNVSYNDATADAKPGFAAVSVISTVSETIVEGNIVIAGPDTRVLMGHHNWQGLPTDVTYRGNIFVGNNKAPVESSVLTGGRFEANFFINVPTLPDGISSDGSQVGFALVSAMQRQIELRQAAGHHVESD